MNAGVTSLPITVTINGYGTVEPSEHVFMSLKNSRRASIGDNLGVGTIVND